MIISTPLEIGIFISIWYTFWIVVVGMIYIGIFKWFTKIGGRRKAKKILRAPDKNLERFINRYDLKYAWKVYKAVEGEDRRNTKCGVSVDSKWMDTFIQLCHWCGYQVVIRKDSEKDIEPENSDTFDMNFLEDFGKKFIRLNEKTKVYYSGLRKKDEDLKREFEL